ncbi:MAG TPA: cupredoxin domain-containing protein [Terracidiphilus sp.]|jgi:cytochrome c oxidase subunit 2
MKKLTVILYSSVAALLFGCMVCTAAQSASQPQRIEVSAKRFDFNPATITVKKGEPVVLVLKSEDVSHGIRFRELGLEVKASKGGSAELHFTPQKTGDFVGQCSVFCGSGHGHMHMTLHVVD